MSADETLVDRIVNLRAFAVLGDGTAYEVMGEAVERIRQLEAERDHALHALGLAGGLLYQAWTAHESPQQWVERLLQDAAEEMEAER